MNYKRSMAFAIVAFGCLSWMITACLPANLTNQPTSQNQVDTAVQSTLTAMTATATSRPVATPTTKSSISQTLAVTSTQINKATKVSTANPGSPTPVSLFPQGVLIAGIGCVPRNTQQDLAVVVQVLDGDTIQVIINGKTETVKYIGIDAPAMPSGSNPGGWKGTEAYQKNKSLVDGKIVVLVRDVSDTDASGNLLRYVLTDTFFVNYDLVQQGFAVALAVQPDTSCRSTFETAQVSAMSKKLGVWQPTPTSTERPFHLPSLTPTKIPSNH